MRLDEPVINIKQVSGARAKALNKMGIFTVRDLVTNFPRYYINLSNVCSISNARPGQKYTIAGTIHEIKLKRPKPNLQLVEIAVVDQASTMIVTMFRQPWLMNQLKAGMNIACSGKLEFNYGFKRMTNPFLEVIGSESDAQSAAKIIPVHPACDRVSPAWMRRLIGNALDYIKGVADFIPPHLVKQYKLLHYKDALRMIHFPQTMAQVAAARRTLKYGEVLLLQTYMIRQTNARSAGLVPTPHRIDGPALASIMNSLPFELTDDQNRVFLEIAEKISAPTACNHLVFGDVGTGKTVLALLASACAADTGTQTMMMAPTEILARQHFKTFLSLAKDTNLEVALLTSGTTAADRSKILDDFSSGKIDVLIGTHALIEPDVVPKKCSLVIIDEQQRFGVEQRKKLLDKGKLCGDSNPDTSSASLGCPESGEFSNSSGSKECAVADALYLTATPIPRTLAIALYGDLTFSHLFQRPGNPPKRTTDVVAKNSSDDVYDKAHDALEKGQQVYVVCPLIGKTTEERNKMAGVDSDFEKSQSQAASMTYDFVALDSEDDFKNDNITAAKTHADVLQNKVFNEYNVGLLHGKLSSAEKKEVMDDFAKNKIQVLVSTTVIEVGVDVQNATVMIVEDADRFGLSQLHQLRGRVGRGQKEGHVYLVSGSTKDEALSRLNAVKSTEDGFKLATHDLELRREGNILGSRQHGKSIMKLINVVRDAAIVQTANKDARAIIEDDPDLQKSENKMLSYEMSRSFTKDGKPKK